jgi:sporulation protein YlmC with PRC-barrel domain
VTPSIEEETADASTPPADEQIAAAEEEALEPAPAATADEQAAATAPAASTEVVFLSFAPEQLRATSMLGQAIYGPDDESIGEVADIVLEEDGKTRAALIDVGGFLGVGEKTVAIPFAEIQASAGEEGMGERLVVTLTRDELEQLPAIEIPTEESAAIEQPATLAPAAPDQTAGAEAPTAPADEEIITGSVEEPTPVVYEAATQDLSANQLIGSTVYGPDDATLGEVGDVIFDQAGIIEGVEIDVGGFLGFGEKPVAVGFDALQIHADENGSLLVMVNATNEQLESAPTYEEAPEAAAVQ